MSTVAILHNIRSAHNVGSIFRTADGAGISKLYLTGYTPAPLDRFGRPVKEIAKTALGAEKTVAWEKIKSAPNVLEKLSKQGYVIAAIEQSKKSVPYVSYKPHKPLVLVLGNEVLGLDKKILGLSDVVLEIPMRGLKESLNVAVAFGIVAYALAATSPSNR